MASDSSGKFKFAAGVSDSQFTRRRFLRDSGAFLALQAALPRRLSSLPRRFAGFTSAELGCLSPFRTSYPPQLQDLIAKLDPSADDFPSEVFAASIEKILNSWSAALSRSVHSAEIIAGALADSIEASPMGRSDVAPLRTAGPLRTERRRFDAAHQISRKAFLAAFSSYLEPFESIQVVELELFGLRVTGESPLRIETDIRYDIVGTNKDQSRGERVGTWKLTWTERDRDRWMAERWQAGDELRSHLTGPGFTEITASCLPLDGPGMRQLLPGIDDWRASIDGACGIDIYGNHGIAAGDIDGTGFDSFYVCQPSGLPNRLYRNRGDGTFEDITKSSGTGILDGTASALFVDFRNSGRQDLLVVRTSGPLLFENLGEGKFQPRPDAFQFASPPQGTFTSAAVADYDRDGMLDVYFCVYSYYQGLNQYQYPSPYYDAQNGPPNFLFRNRGDGTFEDVTATAGMNQNNNRFSFAAAWCDYDNTGWPSLYVANDFGRKNLYHNDGNGTFTDVADSADVEDYGPGMSTCWLDYDGDGRQDVYVANMWLKEGKRITANDRFLPDAPESVRALYRKHNDGNSMYRNAGNGAFENRSGAAGTAVARWSWSCAPWDFDNDGFPDLYVANGFVSGPIRRDLQSFFWRQVAQRSFAPAGSSVDYELAWNAVNELVRSDYSWSGYQRNNFFANNRDATFSDVAGVLGLDFIDDSRAFALSDFDHDGRLEFVLKNRTGPQLRVVRNDLKGIGNSVAIRLTGSKSNRDAIGAAVTIEAGGKRQTQFVAAGSGFASQHTRELFFGVGEWSGNISVSIQWPSGATDRFENVPENRRISIQEGNPQFAAAEFRPAPPGSKGAAKSPSQQPVFAAIETWLVAPLHAPSLKLPDLNGNVHDLAASAASPAVLCFFTAGCDQSRAQLDALQKASADLSATSLSVLCVSVSPGSSNSLVQEFVRASKISFPILIADEQTAGAWNIQYRYLFDRRRNMPFPSSFLIDRTGAVVKLYQGVAEPSAIIADAASIPATPEQSLSKALPFAGPYYGNPIKHNYFTYGVAFIEYGYLDAAQSAFERVVEANPEFVAGWFNLGTTFLNRKMYPEARKALLEAVRLDPNDADAWNNLGMISGELDNYDEALDEFRNSARANPNSMLAVQNMVRIYEFQNRPGDAQKALEELVALSPQNADLHLGLANTLIAQQDFSAARKELEIAAGLQSKRTDILNNLGVVLLRLGERTLALERFEECQRTSPDFDRPFINAALIYQGDGQIAKAQEVLSAFLARHPDDRDVRGALEKLGGQ